MYRYNNTGKGYNKTPEVNDGAHSLSSIVKELSTGVLYGLGFIMGSAVSCTIAVIYFSIILSPEVSKDCYSKVSMYVDEYPEIKDSVRIILGEDSTISPNKLAKIEHLYKETKDIKLKESLLKKLNQ